jgi:PPOX class probable F420-dependent enzyme
MPVEQSISDFVARRHVGTLATIRRNGRPQLSNVSYTFDPHAGEHGTVRISLTGDRAKVKNLRRDLRASMLVQSSNGWLYAVVEGDTALSAITTSPDDDVCDELVEIYRAIAGKEHPDWAEFRDAMVAQQRLVGRLHVTHGYGLPVR